MPPLTKAAPNKSREGSVRMSPLEIHVGQALAKIATTYPRLFEDGVVMELVQNAIDSDAVNIWVNIDMQKRNIIVRDDGFGASIEDFEEALTSVFQTLKVKNRLGRYGLGLVSPTGKCERFVFLSTTKKDPHDFHEWVFVCDEIIQIRSEIKIPCTRRPDLSFSRTKDKGVPWRTEMRIEKFRKELRAQRLSKESLTRAIQDRFSRAMLGNDTVVHVTATWEDGRKDSWDIKAQKFRGAPLKKHLDSDKDSGHTEFEIYLSPKNPTKGFKGEVQVGESDNNYRIPFSALARSSASAFLPEDIVAGFKSGIFEGQITNSRIKLNPDRKSFEENEALMGFCLAIERWFKEIGIECLEEVKTASREEKYQALGIRSMKVVEEAVLGNPELMAVIKGFRKGTQGSRHAEVGEVVGTQKGPALSTRSAGVGRAELGDGEKSYPHADVPDRTYERHMPFTVRGPKGQIRSIVRGDSIGLQFSYEGLDGSNKLWDLNKTEGILSFNTRHPLWVQAEAGKDRCLMEFQEMLAIHALHLEAYPDEYKDHAQFYLETALPSLIFLILKADDIAGRKTITNGRIPKKKM